MKSRIIGVESKMNEFDFLLGMLASEFLFPNCDNLSKALLSDTISASEGQRNLLASCYGKKQTS